MSRILQRIALAALAILLAPLELLAGVAAAALAFVGAVLAFVGAIGTPIWMLGTLLWLLGGSTRGDALPPWAMLLLLIAAVPTGLLLLEFGYFAPNERVAQQRRRRRAEECQRSREEAREQARQRASRQHHSRQHGGDHRTSDHRERPGGQRHNHQHAGSQQGEHQQQRPARGDGDRGDPIARAYQTLELQQGASADEIKAAYRRLAHLYHPDHNPGFTHQAAQRFAEVQAAYDKLTGVAVV